MLKIKMDNFYFTEIQKEHICDLLTDKIDSQEQINCFIEELEKGLTYYLSQKSKSSLHNSFPEAYKDNDIKKLKESLDQVNKQLISLNDNARSIINCSYYLRERKSISSGDWRLPVQTLLGDISIACSDLLSDSKMHNRKRGYRLELLILDCINSSISKNDIKLNIAIGGNVTPCERLLNYIIEQLEIKGNNNQLASGRSLIERWLTTNCENENKQEEQTVTLKEKNTKNNPVQKALNTWKPLTRK